MLGDAFPGLQGMQKYSHIKLRMDSRKWRLWDIVQRGLDAGHGDPGFKSEEQKPWDVLV